MRQIEVNEVNVSCDSITINADSIESIRQIRYPVTYPDAKCVICCNSGREYIVSDEYYALLETIYRAGLT